MDIPNESKTILTVSEITREIKYLLETSLPAVWIEGEISNFVHHSSGHMYFSLKDEDAQIACVMWRSRNIGLFFTPTDGMRVRAHGLIRVYAKRGNYQLDIDKMVPGGIGELQLAFERLKEKLRAEGLFDEEHKKPLPVFPQCVGIVTSPTGAAIRDIVHVIKRRMPSTTIILRPALVQGEGAAQDIARAIDEFNDYAQVDVLIVGRGGGSLEDLWAFNEEAVARAIFRSKIPVVSAVGHEIDFTISDFVADLRAPTPSAAAEMVVPESEDILTTVRHHFNQIGKSVRRLIEYYHDRLEVLRSSYGMRKPADVVQQNSQRIDELYHICNMGIRHILQNENDKLYRLKQRIGGLAPESVLKRGYSICMQPESNRIIASAAMLEQGDPVKIQLYRGRILGTTEQIWSDKKWTDS